MPLTDVSECSEDVGDGEISSFGALFWMVVTAFFGMATKYSEGLLAVKYRVITKDGHSLGGPFYYIERGMGKNWKWLLPFLLRSLYQDKHCFSYYLTSLYFPAFPYNAHNLKYCKHNYHCTCYEPHPHWNLMDIKTSYINPHLINLSCPVCIKVLHNSTSSHNIICWILCKKLSFCFILCCLKCVILII